jgi:hypothetical protein
VNNNKSIINVSFSLGARTNRPKSTTTINTQDALIALRRAGGALDALFLIVPLQQPECDGGGVGVHFAKKTCCRNFGKQANHVSDRSCAASVPIRGWNE